MSVSAQRGVRRTFAAVVIFYLLVLPLTWWAGHEPYPAINMPTFPLYKGETERTQATLVVNFADGQSASVGFPAILPETPLEPIALVSTTFKDDRVASDPEIVGWLHSRIAQQFPGQTPVSADIAWRVTAYRGEQQTHTPLETIHVEFE